MVFFLFSTMSAKADPVVFAERLENFRQLSELFRQICMSQGQLDPVTGVGQFAENVVYTNINFSPDHGSVDCNANLKALTRLQKDLEDEANRLEESKDTASCDVPEVLSATAQDDAEKIAVAAGEAEMALGCKADYNTENLCLDRFTCSFQKLLSDSIRKQKFDTSYPAGAPTRSDGGSCQGVGDLALSCGFTGLNAIFDSVGNFLSGISSTLNWSGEKVSRISANIEIAAGNIAHGDEMTVNQVDILTESDNAVIDAFVKFRHASASEKGKMLRQLGVNLWNGINTAIKKSYGCIKWKGKPYASECLTPMENFCSAPCQQKTDAICGVLTYFTTDVIIAGFTSGAASKIGKTAMHMTRGSDADTARALAGLDVDVSEAPSTTRRMNRIRELSGTNLRLANRFAVIHARHILDLPLSKAIKTGGDAFLKRVGPGVDRAKKTIITSAKFVNPPARWVASGLYAPIKFYTQLSKTAFELGSKSVGNGASLVNDAVSGAKVMLTANLLEVRPEGLPLTSVRTLVHYTDKNRNGDPVPRSRWVVTELEPVSVQGTDLFHTSPPQNSGARASASVAEATEDGSVVIVARGLSRAELEAQNNLFGKEAPVPILSAEEILERIGDSPYNQAVARAAREELRVPGDFSGPLEDMQKVWRENNPNAPPGLLVNFPDLPPTEQMKRLNDFIEALKVGNPQVLQREGFRQFRASIETRLPKDPASRFDPEVEARLKTNEADLKEALQAISPDVKNLTRSLDELGVHRFFALYGSDLSEAAQDRIRMLYERTVKDRYTLSVQGKVPKPPPAPGSDLPSLEDLITAYEKRINTTPEQNLAFIGHANRPTPPGGLFIDSQNRMLKWLNDNLKTKGAVDALSNRHTEMALEALDALRSKYPGLTVTPYADYKGLRVFARWLPNRENKMLEEIRNTLADVDRRFMDELKRGRYVPEEALKKDWFSTTVQRTADEANIQARFPNGTSLDDIMKKWEDVDTMRASLQARSRFRYTLMHKPSGTRKYILKADVIEVIRKNKDDVEAMKILNRRYGADVKPQDMKDMRAYMSEVDNFSPGLLIEERQLHELAAAVNGGATIDFTKFGAYNIEATMAGMARGHDFKSSVREIRLAEEALTAEMHKLKKSTENALRSVLDKNRIEYDITVSGDDLVMVPRGELSEKVRREIVLAQAAANVPSSMRISFFRSGIVNQGDRGKIAAEGEGIEKILRHRLDEVLTQEELKRIVFATDMQGMTPGTGQVGLFTNSPLSPDRMALVEREFRASVETANKINSTTFTAH